ncbi:prepilin-type N-terminal cleavage/methylation domain-containing protein [Candidatus Dojkabacteria bacterium]|nr:prepilin-type N-terminal cleavage/methylation domain-containing protein [Candidatus Dojkabacteria bacterium]
MEKISNPKRALTLLEVLIVMSIALIVIAGGSVGFLAIRRVQLVDQAALNFKDNLENAKHSALVTKRGAGENWVYGIGVDLSMISTKNTYSLFKMCSNSGGYTPLSSTLFNLFDWRDLGGTSCTGVNEGIVYLPGKKDLSAGSGLKGIALNTDVKYIIFESVTGRVYFVSKTGAIFDSKIDSLLVTFGAGKSTRIIKITSGASIEFVRTTKTKEEEIKK